MNSQISTDQKISPCLWFAGNALEAAEFYVSLFPGSSVDHVHKAAADTPGTPEGSVILVGFTLAGTRYQALNGGMQQTPSHAMSLSVSCEDQGEVDRLWSSLLSYGGKEIACGWLQDRYGFAWQIVPKRLVELISDPDPARARRAMKSMMTMVKIDIAELERAVGG